MKTAFLCLCMIPFFIGNNLSYAQEVRAVETLHKDITDDALKPWFEALVEGDVVAIGEGLSDEMYPKYEKLLKKNKGYPKFLKEHFKDARFEITSSEETEGGVSFGVTIIMPEERGGRHPTTVYMQDAPPSIPGGDAKWKVASTKETFELKIVDELRIVDE